MTDRTVTVDAASLVAGSMCLTALIVWCASAWMIRMGGLMLIDPRLALVHLDAQRATADLRWRQIDGALHGFVGEGFGSMIRELIENETGDFWEAHIWTAQ